MIRFKNRVVRFETVVLNNQYGKIAKRYKTRKEKILFVRSKSSKNTQKRDKKDSEMVKKQDNSFCFSRLKRIDSERRKESDSKMEKTTRFQQIRSRFLTQNESFSGFFDDF